MRHRDVVVGRLLNVTHLLTTGIAATGALACAKAVCGELLILPGIINSPHTHAEKFLLSLVGEFVEENLRFCQIASLEPLFKGTIDCPQHGSGGILCSVSCEPARQYRRCPQFIRFGTHLASRSYSLTEVSLGEFGLIRPETQFRADGQSMRSPRNFFRVDL